MTSAGNSIADARDDDRGNDNFAAIEGEVRAAFDAYEAALVANDVDAMDRWFWSDDRVVRFGIADVQHGFTEVAAWRRTATPVPTTRRLFRVDVVAFGPDVAVATCEFRNGDDRQLGRQTQVWARTAAGWRIASAHVSMIDG